MFKQTYAFIAFEGHESAVDAVKDMDNKVFVNGEKLVVEQSGRENSMNNEDTNLNYDCSARRKEKEERRQV